MRVRIKPLDKLFSHFIRLRAMETNHGCERCGAWKADYKWLQCSHFFGRAKKSVRFDEENAAGLCFGCHQYFTSHPLEHTEWFKERLGDRFDLLVVRANTVNKPDEDLIGLYLKGKIKELENWPHYG